jgi:hypothetical protein
MRARTPGFANCGVFSLFLSRFSVVLNENDADRLRNAFGERFNDAGL